MSADQTLGGGLKEPGATFMRVLTALICSSVIPSGERPFVAGGAFRRSAASFWTSRISRSKRRGPSSTRIFQISSVVML